MHMYELILHVCFTQIEILHFISLFSILTYIVVHLLYLFCFPVIYLSRGEATIRFLNLCCCLDVCICWVTLVNCWGLVSLPLLWLGCRIIFFPLLLFSVATFLIFSYYLCLLLIIVLAFLYSLLFSASLFHLLLLYYFLFTFVWIAVIILYFLYTFLFSFCWMEGGR